MLKFISLSLFLLMGLSSQGAVLISVQDQISQPGWSHEICKLMYRSMNSIMNQEASCFVIPASVFSDERIRKLRSTNQYHTHLRVFRDQNQHIEINTQQWIRDDDTDFLTSTFTINKTNEREQKENLSLFARNWSAYRLNRDRYKADILASALPESKEIKLNSKGEMVDSLTMNPISLKKAYSLFSNENFRQKKYLRTALEISAVLGFGLYLYYKNLASMKVDHDYKSVKEGVSKKLNGSAIREDDNNTAANIGHVFAGEIYFLVARNNGLNFIEASLATLASSAAWEFLEYKEVFSINDEILTGWSGAVLGEVFYQMSRAIRNKSTSFVGRALAAVFNPVGALNNQVNSLMGMKPQDVKFGDLDTSQWSRFEFTFLVGRQRFQKAGSSEDYKGIEMKGLVINIPNWDKPGTERQLLLETPVAEFEFAYTQSRFGVEDFKLVAQAVLAGLHEKNRDEQNGYEYIIGLSSGFEWDQKRSGPLAFEESANKERDLWARAHIIGSTIRAVGLYKGIKFNLEMKVHADYVLVSSYALEQMEKAEGGREGLLSVMKKRGYYYGTGWSQQLKASAEYNDWGMGWSINRTDVSNSGFPHRFDNQMTKDYSYSDERIENRFFIRRILNRSWAIEVAVAKVERTGEISDLYSRKTTEKKTELKLHYIW